MKRAFDIFVSAFLIALLFMPFIVISIILRYTGEKEVFYWQVRIGYKNRSFKILKFATMLKDSPTLGAGDITLKNDNRILPFGYFLRRTKINELPQLWNVLRGDMSIVGPRPQTTRITSFYPDFYRSVLDHVRPGITGIASIAFRDEETILGRASDYHYSYYNEIIPYKAELERWYADNRSFKLDLLLIFLTAWVIMRPNDNILFRLYPSLPRYEDWRARRSGLLSGNHGEPESVQSDVQAS